MISFESEVLQRHLPLFKDKSVLLTGNIHDQFPSQLKKDCREVHIWSWYFDYARTQTEVNTDLRYSPQADLIIYYWTKNKHEVNFQLMQLLSQCSPEQEILIIGENRSGVRSAEKLLAPYGEIGKIDSARRCSLYHFCLKKLPHFALESYWKTYQHPKLEQLNIYNLPGVFSANELDTGTELLLSTLTHAVTGKVLDLGCGAGVIGVMLKSKNPNIELTMTDIHSMAIESSRRTLAENHLTGNVFASDVFSHIQDKFDLIISNPPFHDGIDTAYRAVQELIQQAKQHLNKGGELRIVVNAFLPYPDILQQYFGSFQVLAKTNKFKVYSVIHE